ncbi:MAG: D-mannonate oxidoreductase, partial [uncultured Quadrisphaera sp.]
MTGEPRPARGRDAGPARPVRAVHLGLGAFHRAHQAWYAQGAGDGWGIAAFTGRRPDAALALAEQEGLYTLLTRDAEGDRAEVVASITSAHDGADAAAWSGHLGDPSVAVLTLTVTEAGYRRAPGGGLDLDDPQVAADVAALRSDP